MRHVFIINPIAGKGKDQSGLVERIKKAAEKLKAEYRIRFTKAPYDAIDIAREECSVGDEVRVYACGGDGTANEVANGLVGFENAQMGIVPCGTGNDFLKNFGEYNDFLDIEAQMSGEAKSIDAIKINDRICINSCSVGIDASVAANVHRFKKIPLVSGSIGYTLSLVYCFFTKISNYMNIDVDGKKTSGKYLLSLIANGKVYGGGYIGAPKAVVNDGKLDVISVKKISRLKILNVLNKYKAGKHLDDPSLKGIIDFTRAENVKITLAAPASVEFDGECVEIDTLNINIIKNALRFSIPKGLSLT